MQSARQWHVARARAIIREHPEARALEGPLALTALAIAALVALQFALAVEAARLTWPLVFALAWSIGAIPALGLFVLLHEGSHDLIFASRRANRCAMVIASAPLLLPCAPGFAHYHLEHHRALGEAWRDVDCPAAWETRLLQSGATGRALWLGLWPLLQLARLATCRPHRVWDAWFAVNLAVNAAFAVTLWSVGAGKAIAYCALSLGFAFGLHPFGGRMLQEHLLTSPRQPSASYYGPANRLLFNAGFHVEHHDFLRVPWLRLPRLRSIAPHHYEGLAAHRSWSKLALRFIGRGSIATR